MIEYPEIKALIGTPYSQMDCYDCVAECFRIVNNPIYRYDDMKEHVTYDKFVKKSGMYGLKFYEVIVPTFADIICFTDNKGMVGHIGFMLNQRQFIHSHREAGVCISRTNDYISSYKFLRRE